MLRPASALMGLLCCVQVKKVLPGAVLSRKFRHRYILRGE